VIRIIGLDTGKTLFGYGSGWRKLGQRTANAPVYAADVEIPLREGNLDARVAQGRVDRHSEVAANLETLLEARDPDPQPKVESAVAEAEEESLG
jgi:hypothetical protein